MSQPHSRGTDEFRAHALMRARVAAALNVANPSPSRIEREQIVTAVQAAAGWDDLPIELRNVLCSWEHGANEAADSLVASGDGEFHLAGRHNQANHGRRKLNPTFSPFTKAQKVARDALRMDNLDPDTPRAWRTPDTPARKVAKPRGSLSHPRKGEREQPPIPTAAQKKTAAATDKQTAAHVAAKKAAPAPAKKAAPAKMTGQQKVAARKAGTLPPPAPNPGMTKPKPLTPQQALIEGRKIAVARAAKAGPPQAEVGRVKTPSAPAPGKRTGAAQDLSDFEQDTMRALAKKTDSKNQATVTDLGQGNPAALRGLLGLQRKGHVTINKDKNGQNVVTVTPQGQAAGKLLAGGNIRTEPRSGSANAPVIPAATPNVPAPAAPAATRAPTAAAPSARSIGFPPFIDGKTEASDLSPGETDTMRALKKNIKTTTGSTDHATLMADPGFSIADYGNLVSRGLVSHGDGGKRIQFTPEGLATAAAIPAAPKVKKVAKKAAPKVAAPAAPAAPAKLADLPKTGPQKTMLQGLGRITGSSNITTWRQASAQPGWNASSRGALEKAGYIEIDRSNPPVKIKLTAKGRDAANALERGEGNMTDDARRDMLADAAIKAAPAGQLGVTKGQSAGAAASSMPSKAYRSSLPKADQIGPHGNPKAGIASQMFGKGKGVGDDSIVPGHKNPGNILADLETDDALFNDVKAGWEATQAGRTRNGGNQYLTALAKAQGTAGKPHVATKAEIDAAVAAGAREGWRGVTIPYQGPPPTTKDIHDQLRHDDDTYYGNGVFGNGIYIAETKHYADSYSQTNDDHSLVRIAISPNAKVIDYHDLTNELNQWLRANPTSRMRAYYNRDPAAYAMAAGYDAIATPSGTTKTNYNFLNRTALMVAARGQRPR